MRFEVLTAVSVVCAAGCATQGAGTLVAATPARPAEAAATAPDKPITFDSSKPLPPGLDEASFNWKASPCDDFYEFACGGWMATTEIPGDRPLYSRGFVAIADRNELALKAILDDAAAGKLPADAAFAKQLGDAYATCTDEAKLETALAQVKAFADPLVAPKNAAELAKNVGLLHASGMPAFFTLTAWQDLKDASQVIGGIDQGGLGLPDRDYYVDEDKKPIREAYLAHVEAMLAAWGLPAAQAKEDAAQVLALETQLAKASQTRVERRDPTKLYNRLERKGLKEKAAGFGWDAYLTALGAPKLETINVTGVKFVEAVSAIAKEGKPAAWKAYLTWTVLRMAVPGLPKTFQDAAFAFSAKHFTGAKEDRPRWKKCVGFVDSDLGEALGREFARRYFPADSKARTSAMIEALQGSVEANLKTLAWLDDATRQAALSKAGRMVANNKIGYPAVWRDYASVKTARTSYFENMVAAARFEVQRQLGKIGKPVDKAEWLMSPPTVNAYYDPQKNEIVFPAGILQPPFFNKDATDAVNFGSMGMVVGHEITHGFDDEGRQFDVDGNLKDWWSEPVGKAFVEKAACVKRQFDGYTAVDDVKLKGDLTLGENIADLGGLKHAHQALESWYQRPEKTAEGAQYRFTPSQQFFLGFAQSWCTKVRPEQAKLRAATDPHASPYWRVNGPVGNLDAFRKAFQCTERSKMVRSGAQQCVVF